MNSKDWGTDMKRGISDEGMRRIAEKAKVSYDFGPSDPEAAGDDPVEDGYEAIQHLRQALSWVEKLPRTEEVSAIEAALAESEANLLRWLESWQV